MTFFSVSNPFMQVLNLQGTGLNDGDVYFGVAGQDPITHPKTVYWNIGGTDVVSQPVETTGGYLYRSGTPAAVFVNDTYSIKVLDKNGATVYYQANVYDPVFQIAADLQAFEDSLAAAGGADLIGASQDQTYIQGTLGDHYKRFVYATDAPFNAKGDGTTDDAAAINAAIAYVATNGGGEVFLPAGLYKTTVALGGAYSNVKLIGAGWGATVILPDGWVDGVRFSDGYPSPTSILSNVGVHNLTIDCTNQTAGASDTNGNAVNFNSCDNYSCQNVQILKVKQQGIAQTYFSVAGSVPKGGIIRGNYVDISLSTNIAIGIEGNSQKAIVNDNQIDGITNSFAIYAGNIGGSGVSGNLSISENILNFVSGNTALGIRVEDGIKKVIIATNVLIGPSIGIRCSVTGTNSTYNYTVVNNTVNDYTVTACILGPVVSGDASQALCSSNTFTTTVVGATAAVIAAGGAFVVANQIDFGGSGGGILITGDGTTVGSNRIHGTANYAIDASGSTNTIILPNDMNRDVNLASDTKINGSLGNGIERWNTAYIGTSKSIPNPDGNTAPASGTWAQDDKVWNNSVSATGYIGFVCTAAGTPGTWKGFGQIAA